MFAVEQPWQLESSQPSRFVVWFNFHNFGSKCHAPSSRRLNEHFESCAILDFSRCPPKERVPMWKVLKVSREFLDRVESLPKRSDRIFNLSMMNGLFYHQPET